MNDSYYQLDQKSLGIYIHVPWCLQKCHYCDFYSIAIAEENHEIPHEIPIEFIELYIEKLLWELELRLHDQSHFRKFEKITSIYFGGGTPSLLPLHALSKLFKKLLKKIHANFDLVPNCEISLEGNPENMDPEYLAQLHDLGIRRVNVGLQSFQANVLEKMNRFYSQERYASILQDLSDSPFQSYGIDLIYGFPGQSKADFYRDLERVLAISPAHLSLYSLTVENNTAYGKAVHNKSSPAPDEELQDDIWEGLSKKLGNANLQHYEVSNFAKEDQWCRHNLSYWLYAPYIGLGPGAHGFDGHFRYANPRNLQQWLRAREQNPYSTHEPELEMPLMFLRLCAPWPLYLWEKLLLERCSFTTPVCKIGMECLYKWAQQGLAEIFPHTKNEREEKFFQWNHTGLSFLNDRIAEMHSALTSAAQARNP